LFLLFSTDSDKLIGLVSLSLSLSLSRTNYHLSCETGLGISQLRMTLTGIGKGGWWIRMFICVLRFGFMYAMKVTLANQLRLVHNGTKTNLV
jgi:hypothetical protein